MSIRVLSAGDAQGSSATSSLVAEAMKFHAVYNGDYAAFVPIGCQSDGGFYSQLIANWDAPGGWGDYNAVCLPVPGDQDFQAAQNFGVSGYLAQWQADSPPTAFPSGFVIPFQNRGVDALPLGVGNDRLYQAAVVGTQTGDTEPDWPTTYGQTVVDGDFVWQCIQPGSDFYNYFREVPAIDPSDPTGQSVIWSPLAGIDGFTNTRRPGSTPCRLLQSVNPAYGAPGTGTVYNPDNAYYAATLIDSDDPSNVWRIYCLNSQIEYTHYAQGGISLGSKQALWLQQDMAQWQGVPKVVAWHKPRFWVPYDVQRDEDNSATADIFRLCVQSNTKVFLWGGEPVYERFDPVGVDDQGNVVSVAQVGNVMQPQSAAVIVAGNAGGKPVGGSHLYTGGAHARALAQRPTDPDMIDGGSGVAATSAYFGATALDLEADGFGIHHVVGCLADGVTGIDYDPAAGSASIFDSVVYTFREASS